MITNTHTYELTNCFDGAIAGRNHFTDTIHGSFTLPQQETISIQLFDNSGRLMQAADQRAVTGLNSYSMTNLETLPQGIYTLVMRSRNKLIIEKMIK